MSSARRGRHDSPVGHQQLFIRHAAPRSIFSRLLAGYVQVTPATGFSTTSSGGSLNLGAVEQGGPSPSRVRRTNSSPSHFWPNRVLLSTCRAPRGQRRFSAPRPVLLPAHRGLRLGKCSKQCRLREHHHRVRRSLIAGTILSQLEVQGASGRTVDITASEQHYDARTTFSSPALARIRQKRTSLLKVTSPRLSERRIQPHPGLDRWRIG